MKLHPPAKFHVCIPYQFRDNVPDRQTKKPLRFNIRYNEIHLGACKRVQTLSRHGVSFCLDESLNTAGVTFVPPQQVEGFG